MDPNVHAVAMLTCVRIPFSFAYLSGSSRRIWNLAVNSGRRVVLRLLLAPVCVLATEPVSLSDMLAVAVPLPTGVAVENPEVSLKRRRSCSLGAGVEIGAIEATETRVPFCVCLSRLNCSYLEFGGRACRAYSVTAKRPQMQSKSVNTVGLRRMAGL